MAEGRPEPPDREFKAGGKYANERFIKYQAQNLGLSNYYRFPYNDLERNLSNIEKMHRVPVLGGLLRRFIRVSDRGRVEKLRQAAEDVKQELAVKNIELENMIIEHLNDTENPSRQDAYKLYKRLRTQGAELERGSFGRKFWPKYMVLALYRENNAVVKSFLQAASNDEKAAVLEKAFPEVTVDKRYVRQFKRELRKMFRK